MGGAGLRSERGPLLLAVMLGNALVALDTTIVASAVPSIVASLGDYARFPWVFSIYLLTQAITVPVYGKIADELGRKPVILVGIGLFLLGSLACGCSWNMTSLIVARGVQGLGGGAVQPIATTIAGDLYSVQERAKIQAHIAASWAFAAVFGSAMGGIIAEAIGWRWIFFLNLLRCLACAAILARRYRESRPRSRGQFDQQAQCCCLCRARCSWSCCCRTMRGLP
jgi:multidrug resistance protein